MKKVLIIEDNQDNMKLISFILEKGGYQTVKATTGKAGIEIALKESLDLVLLDIQLPDMDGTDVLETIRNSEVDEKLPVVAITSYAMSGDRERLLSAGCNGYIEKPINPESILAEIQQYTKEIS